MNLKRQLLLVSLLTLVLPWAGYKFIHETESALRTGQQQMLASTARYIGNSLATYPEEFPRGLRGDETVGDQIYGHPLDGRPEVDGYFDDWSIERSSLRALRGTDGPIQFVIGVVDEAAYLYAEVRDDSVVFTRPGSRMPDSGPTFFDAVALINTSPLYLNETIVFSAEAPGTVIAVVRNEYGIKSDPSIIATWRDVPGGYQIEAKIPASRLGTHLGVIVYNTASELQSPARSTTFTSRKPAAFVTVSPDLSRITDGLAQPGMRLAVTDTSGWRIAASGNLSKAAAEEI